MCKQERRYNNAHQLNTVRQVCIHYILFDIKTGGFWINFRWFLMYVNKKSKCGPSTSTIDTTTRGFLASALSHCGVFRDFYGTLKLHAIARNSWNARFDISVAMYFVHLAMSLRALGILVGSYQSHPSKFGFIPNSCFRFRCSIWSSSTFWGVSLGRML